MITNVLKRHPLLISLTTNTVKTVAADLAAQRLLTDSKETDWKRAGIFATFGFGYLGGWQYVLFNKLFPKIETIMHVAKWSASRRAAMLTFIDMGIHTPLMYFPAFYTVKNIVDGKGINNAVHDYHKNIGADIAAMWKLWIPAQMVNFMFVPLHLRMPFITGVSFAWTTILSMMRGKQCI